VLDVLSVESLEIEVFLAAFSISLHFAPSQVTIDFIF
jgi:hypothetical protein